MAAHAPLGTLLCLVVLLLPISSDAATLSKSEAIALANAVAKGKGIDLFHFSTPNASFEPEYKRNEWFVCYKAIASKPSNAQSFYVILNDSASTKNTSLTFGQCT